MAEVAGVGAAGGLADGDARAVDPVASHRDEQAVRGVGHVAVQTTASRRVRGVPGVRGRVGAQRRMALETRFVTGAIRCQLIRRVRVVVQRVARQARHVAALVAARLHHAVELAPRDANGAVLPVAPDQRVGLVGELGEQVRIARRRFVQQQSLRLRELVARAEGEPAPLPALDVHHPREAVALSAHLGRARLVEPGRVDDGRVALLAEQPAAVATQRRAVGPQMLLAGPVASLAGDPELGAARVERLAVEARLGADRVTEMARSVPDGGRLGLG